MTSVEVNTALVSSKFSKDEIEALISMPSQVGVPETAENSDFWNKRLGQYGHFLVSIYPPFYEVSKQVTRILDICLYYNILYRSKNVKNPSQMIRDIVFTEIKADYDVTRIGLGYPSQIDRELELFYVEEIPWMN